MNTITLRIWVVLSGFLAATCNGCLAPATAANRLGSAATTLSIGGGSSTAVVTQAELKEQLRIIADPDLQSDDVVEAIETVRKSPPTPDEGAMWARIADSRDAVPQFASARRRWAKLQLFDRHASPGMTMGELAVILDRPKWLEVGDVYNATWGRLPVDRVGVGDEPVFVIVIKPYTPGEVPTGVYVRLQRPCSPEDLVNALRGNRSPATDLKLTAIGFATIDMMDRHLVSGTRDIRWGAPRRGWINPPM